MDNLSLRRYLAKNDIPQEEINKLMPLDKLCTLIKKLIPRHTNNALAEKLKKYETEHKRINDKNIQLMHENNNLKLNLNKYNKNKKTGDSEEINHLKSQIDDLMAESKKYEKQYIVTSEENLKLMYEINQLKLRVNQYTTEKKVTDIKLRENLPADITDYIHETIYGYRQENKNLVKTIVKLKKDIDEKTYKIRAQNSQLSILRSRK